MILGKKSEEKLFVCIKSMLIFAYQQFGQKETFNRLLSDHILPELIAYSYPNIFLYIIEEYDDRDILIYRPYRHLEKAFGTRNSNRYRKVDPKISTVLLAYLLHLNQKSPYIYTTETILNSWIEYLHCSIHTERNKRRCFYILSAFFLLLEDVVLDDATRVKFEEEFSSWIYRYSHKPPTIVNANTIRILFLSGVIFRIGFIHHEPSNTYTIRNAFSETFTNISLFDMLRVRIEIGKIQDRMRNIISILFNRAQ